jgi:hypothetical protein
MDTPEFSIRELDALFAGPARSLDDLCDSVLASLAPHPRDDIALLLARTTTTLLHARPRCQPGS